MPYEPDTMETVPPLRSRDIGDYKFDIDLWLADADDLELFDLESPAGGKRNFEFLHKIITNTIIRGESKGPGLCGHGVPYPVVKHLFEQVGEELKRLNNAKN